VMPLCFAKPSPPSGWPGDFHPQAIEHARHATKPLRGSSVGSATGAFPSETERYDGLSRPQSVAGWIVRSSSATIDGAAEKIFQPIQT
jgi:hypothetical protein